MADRKNKLGLSVAILLNHGIPLREMLFALPRRSVF